MSWTKEQLEAITKHGKNIIVSAGAGSGKTAVLSERVLEICKNKIHIDNLLILTFTNAAAAEMKDRIRTNLIENNITDELDRIDIADITTFDSYALSLVKKYNHEVNISDNISIIDDSILTLKKKEILTSILDEYYNKKNPLFEKLINDFCLKDDKDIFDAIINYENKLNELYDKEKYLNEYLDKFYSDDYIDKRIEEYLSIIKENINNIKMIKENLEKYTDNNYIKKINEALFPLLNSNTYEDIRYNLYNLELPRLFKADEEAKTIKENISKRIKKLKDLCSYNTINEIKDTLLSTKDYVSMFIELIKIYDKELYDYKKNNNAYEFIDIFKMAIDILKNNDKITNDLKNKYYEILIDEYQDTNDLQDIFISYISNNNVYMVGDIKQSIYRFRNANPYIFKKKYDDYSKKDGGIKIDLNKNFRSRENVVKAINLIFNSIMDDEIGGASYFETHQMIYGNEDYLKVLDEDYDMEILNYNMEEDLEFSKEEIEIFTIAKDIKNKVDNGYTIMDKKTKEKRSVKYKDFVILIDVSKTFNLYKKIFEYLKIPITIMKDSVINDSIDLSIIKNIYNLIISINEKRFDTMFSYSFMAVARSYLFEMNDEEIYKIIKTRSYASTKIYEICYKLAKNLNSHSNIVLYNNIIEKFDFYNKMILTGHINNHINTLNCINSIIENSEKLKYTPKDFYEYLKEIEEHKLKITLAKEHNNSNTVNIMTIHTSKGLEYPICYFAGLSNEFNLRDLKNKFCFDNELGFITPYLDNNTLRNSILKSLLKKKYLSEEIGEKIRLFYVALTRSREKIIFVTHLEENLSSYKENGVIDNITRMSYLKFNDMLSSIYKDIKKFIKQVNINELYLTKNYNKTIRNDFNFNIGTNINVLEKEYENTLINEKRFSKEETLIENKSDINFGLEIHYIYENFDFLKPNYEIIPKDKKIFVDNLINTKIFDNAEKIYHEYEFMYEDKNELKHGIIDLLIFYKDEIKIVDYKLKNIIDDNYLKQLDGYKNYIKSISKLPIKIYLYSILDNELKKLG